MIYSKNMHTHITSCTVGVFIIPYKIQRKLFLSTNMLFRKNYNKHNPVRKQSHARYWIFTVRMISLCPVWFRYCVCFHCWVCFFPYCVCFHYTRYVIAVFCLCTVRTNRNISLLQCTITLTSILLLLFMVLLLSMLLLLWSMVTVPRVYDFNTSSDYTFLYYFIVYKYII